MGCGVSTSFEHLKQAAAALPVAARAELAQFLIASLDVPEETPARDEWLAVARQRMAEVKAGRVTGLAAEDVLRSLLEPRS